MGLKRYSKVISRVENGKSGFTLRCQIDGVPNLRGGLNTRGSFFQEIYLGYARCAENVRTNE